MASFIFLFKADKEVILKTNLGNYFIVKIISSDHFHALILYYSFCSCGGGLLPLE